MRILLVHNQYQQAGGEDVVFAAEGVLLRKFGHKILEYTKDNQAIGHMSRLGLLADTLWSRRAYAELREILRRQCPDLVHFHNTFPLISPAAYYAAMAEGVPVVQTLHNYRLLCANGMLFRSGGPCEDCISKTLPWPAVAYACYRDSRAASGVVATMQSIHRRLGTWTQKVDRYIALTRFAKVAFVRGGLPADRIAVKPNFVPDPGLPARDAPSRRGALFVGRLSEEKGLETLAAAWRKLDLPLKVLGDGPLMGTLGRDAPPNLHLSGARGHDEVIPAMWKSAFLVMPSIWYEGFPMVLVEAFAAGLPVVASRLGAMAELVEDGKTGLLFAPGDPEDLAAKVRWAEEHPKEMRRMGENSRRVYEENYTPKVNYRQLMAIYEQAIEANRRSRRQ